MARAYHGIFGQVRLYNARTQEVTELWAPRNPFLTGISWTRQMNALQSLAITVDMPYEDGIRLLDNNTFAQGTVVEARIGYTDGGRDVATDQQLDTTDWQRGILYQGGVGLTITADGVTGTLEGKPFGSHKKDSAGGKFEKGVTPFQILKEMVEDIGGVAKFEGEASVRANGLVTAENPYAKKGYIVGSKSYVNVIVEMCEQLGLTYKQDIIPATPTASVAGLVGYQTVWTFMTRRDHQAKPAALTLRVRGQFDQQRRLAPLLEFGPELNAAHFGWIEEPSLSRGVIGLDVDDERGVLLRTVLDPKDLEAETGAADAAATVPKDQTVKVGSVAYLVNRATKRKGAGRKIKAETKAEVRNKSELASAKGFSANLITFGIPRTMIGNVVRVEGVGKRFIGNYRVEKETQTFAPGDWKTTLVARNDGDPDNILGGRRDVGENDRKESPAGGL